MIEARELRIGNYYDHNGEIKQVTPNTIQEVWEAKRSWCKGIPLSTYWLERAGFEKTMDYDHGISFKQVPHYHNEIHLVESDGFWHCEKRYDGGTAELWDYEREINSVHQLQNLYFALTGTELEFTLDTPQT